MDESEFERGADDIWLRNRVDPELSALFSEPGRYHARLIAEFIDRAEHDPDLENRLIEALEIAVEEGDDESGGTAWVTLILGEIGSRAAIPVLLRALEETEDETLHESAVDALARIGTPAIEAAADALDEDPTRAGAPGLIRALEAGAVAPGRLGRVRDLLLELFGRAASLEARIVEDLALALARLGERRALAEIREIFAGRFGGRNASLQDAAEMLEEDPSGAPRVSGPAPWRDRFAWLTGRFPTPMDEDRFDLDRLWRGMARPDQGRLEEADEAG